MKSRAAAILFVFLGIAGAAPAQTLNEEIYLPAGESVNLPAARKQTLRFAPRYGNPGSFDLQTVAPGEQRLVYIGGLIVNVTYEIQKPTGPALQEYEFAADNLVIWVRGLKGGNLLGGVSSEPTPSGEKVHIELFMAGNVVVRNREEAPSLRGPKTFVTRTVRADQMYYDVENSKAVATKADLELKFDNLEDSVHVYGEHIERRSRGEWYASNGGAFSSKLPSNPSLRLLCGEATLREFQGERTNFLGIPYRSAVTGEIDQGSTRMLEARNTRINLLGVPIFYTPYYAGDISEPLGPLRGINIGNDRIFGTQILTTWDMYKLLALRPPPGHSWSLDGDYLSKRGPAVGTNYNYSGSDFFGFGGSNFGSLGFYGIQDSGTDILGGLRGPQPTPGLNRGRGFWRHQQELFADRDQDGILNDRYLTIQRQFAYLSDKNFFEEYFKQEFDTGINQESFLFLSGSRGQFYGSTLVQGGLLRNWLTETQWLPNLNGAVVGQSFLDNWIQYEARASAGYARLLPSVIDPLPFNPTDQRVDTGRLDLYQELSVPFDLGPVRLRPYGIIDGTYYSNDLNGNDAGRLYGGGGASAAMTFSKLYRDASSEIFNLHGLNHKVTPWVNYANLNSNVSYNQLPQLDRLQDDTIDLGMRTMNPFFTTYYPGTDGLALQSAPQFNLQQYALRRLVTNRVDTRDDMQVVQTGLFQRLQTKRGQPGREHTIDWMSLGLSASFFPDAERDNFGKTASLLEFNYLWNVGDQTALTAAGWFDPYDVAATNYWTVGAYVQRPNGVNFYAGYRQTDPLNSKVVTISALYTLSKKYAMNLGTSYDFGNQLALSNTLNIYRTGTDLTMGIGVSYNALVNNFGVQFVLIPNLAAAAGVGQVPTPNLAYR